MVTINTPKISDDWNKHLNKEFTKPYFKKLQLFLKEENEFHTIYPSETETFNAFKHTPFDKVKVVIIGQDPYHGPNQANGLCFSVKHGLKIPPSLKNIFKELETDLELKPADHGNLENWAKQGVLLLNASLSVRHKSPGSHQKKGWEKFTDEVIKTLSDQKSGLVFLLWGKYAEEKSTLVDADKHHLLKAPHPSPFSAHKGFFGCKHFSKTNELLALQGKSKIDWKID